MKRDNINKINEVEELEKKIEVYYQLIRRGIEVSKNNDRIEECLKEKCLKSNLRQN